ncbi:adipokinetic hormone/corazonin-related peptide receptor variant I [Lepeophtheirus salmonis]|nr:gonadotropin-releasing hormone II receptor-like [Lepeophtheirus salmonis]
MTFNSAHIISITGYSTLFIISSLANLTVLKILVRRYKKIKSRVNLLLIHLAIADLLVTFFMMPLEIGWAATVMWTAGDLLCRILSFFRIFGLFLSSNILICISLDRFYAIVCPLAAGKAIRNMRASLLMAWIGAIVSASPQMYIFHVESHPKYPWYTQCVTFNSFPSQAYETAYTIFGMIMMYLFPLIVIIVTYTIILTTIFKKSNASRNESRNNTGLRRSGVGVLNRARTRTLKMTVVIVCVFILCWTPYYIISVWFLADKESFMEVDQRIQNSLFMFACTNSCMDPIVYGFFNLRNRQQQPSIHHHHRHNHHAVVELRSITTRQIDEDVNGTNPMQI